MNGMLSPVWGFLEQGERNQKMVECTPYRLYFARRYGFLYGRIVALSGWKGDVR